MATSDNLVSKRHRKGRRNSGPKTERGKEIASQNACKHGILSEPPATKSLVVAAWSRVFGRRLLLSDEAPEEFDALFEGLVASFKPIGTLECMIVEQNSAAHSPSIAAGLGGVIGGPKPFMIIATQFLMVAKKSISPLDSVRVRCSMVL